MTAPYRRTDAIDVSGDHQRRINILEAVSIAAQFDIKVQADTNTTAVGNGAFIFAIPSDIDGYRFVRAEAYVTTVGSTATVLQIRNVTTAQDLLSTLITIAASQFTSYASPPPSVVNLSSEIVNTGQLIAIDVDASGSGARGLGVILDFAL